MKRRNGEGSWSKVNMRGTTYYRFRKSYNGIQKTFYGRTEKEVRQKIKGYEENNPTLSDYVLVEEKTVQEYAIDYVNSIRGNLTPSGYDGYMIILKSRLTDFKEYDLANRLLSNTHREHAKAYVEALERKGYAPKTIRKTVGLIKAVFSDAVANELISSNPFDHIKLPTPEKKQKTFMSKEQHSLFCQTALHKETQDERWNRHVAIGEYTYGIKGLALVIIANTGLRVSELLALTWQRINFDNKTIQVFNSISVVNKRDVDGNIIDRKKEVIVKTPKTSAGIRVVPMTNQTYEVLSNIYSKKDYKPTDLVFSEKNNYLSKDQLRHTCRCIGKRIGLPNLTTHNLRHSFGAIVIHQEHVDPQVVSKLLGHSDVSTTYNYYSDVINEVLAESIKIFNE